MSDSQEKATAKSDKSSAPKTKAQTAEDASDILAPNGPGAGITFLYYFVGTAFVSAALAHQVLHVPFSSGIPNQLGSAVGLVGGLIGTYFNANKPLELPLRGQKALMKRLTPILDDMGYTPIDRPDLENTKVFTRSGSRSLFSGKIYITFMGKTAVVNSRAAHIRELAKRVKA